MIQPFDDTYFMKKALVQAQMAFDKGEVPVGAVIVSHNQIIAKAHNLTEQLNDFTAHAEMQAYTSASSFLGNKYLNECTLYVTLEPCMMCAGAAAWTRVSKIVFGAYDSKKGFTQIKPKIGLDNTTVLGGILAEESEHLLRDFFQKKRSSPPKK